MACEIPPHVLTFLSSKVRESYLCVIQLLNYFYSKQFVPVGHSSSKEGYLENDAKKTGCQSINIKKRTFLQRLSKFNLQDGLMYCLGCSQSACAFIYVIAVALGLNRSWPSRFLPSCTLLAVWAERTCRWFRSLERMDCLVFSLIAALVGCMSPRTRRI